MLPKISPAFEAFIAPARDQNQLWRLVVGTALISVIYVGCLFAIFPIAQSVFGELGWNFPSIDEHGNDFVEPAAMAVLLFSFGGLILGALTVALALHKRGLGSLIGPDLAKTRRHFSIAVHVAFPVLAAVLVVLAILDPGVPNLPFGVWISWMPLALPLLLVQVSAEEIVFRGYLQQQLAARFSSPVVWMILPSLLFGLLHYDPETLGPNAWLVVADTALFGLIAADVTARTGNLGAAIGFHFANNLFAMFLVAMGGPLTGLSLYVTRYDASDVETIRLLLSLDFIFYLACYLVYRKIMARRGF